MSNKQHRISKMGGRVCPLVVVVVGVCLNPAVVFAGPEIWVDPQVAYNAQGMQMGDYWTQLVTVGNSGDAVLEVSEIQVLEIQGGPFGWLSVLPTSLTVQPGLANVQQVEVRVDAARCDLSTILWGELRLISNATSGSGIVYVAAEVTNPAQEVHWDTVTSHAYMFDEFFEPEGECVALAVSDHGAMGIPGWRDIGLDYYESGQECGERDADRVYLYSGSPFVMIKDGDNVSLTTSIYQSATLKPYHWRQAPGSPGMSGGLGWTGYDSVYIGKMVNSDTSLGMERIYYAPRDFGSLPSGFVACHTVIYSADGQEHQHVTVGDIIDWNVPSEYANQNTSGVYNDHFLYVQGTDSSGESCQPDQNRFATEVLWGEYTTADWRVDPCALHLDTPNVRALGQWLLADTAFYRDGTPLTPPQPNPLVWWEESSIFGSNPNPTAGDQAVLLTYKADFTLAATDTLHFWTTLITLRDGTLADLETQACCSKLWWKGYVRGCSDPLSCCNGRVGDVNMSGGCWEEVSIGDVTAMIDAKFIAGACIEAGPQANITCVAAADINQSSGDSPATCDDVTIGDITILIDYLFITGPTLGLPNCP